MGNDNLLKKIWHWLAPPLPPDLPVFSESGKSTVRGRVPSRDEMALGFTSGKDSDGRRIFQLKGISQKARSTHFYVIGASGTGKTKFLESLIKQDIKNGEGFGVLDPHGDLIENLKAYIALAEDDLNERVVLIDPTDKINSVCFNPLELSDGVSPAAQAAELVLVFKKIWGDSWGARMEDIFRNTLIVLIENGLTLAEVPLILTDDAVRVKLTANIKNETCRDFFAKFDSWSKTVRREWTESTLNKVNAFLSDDRVRQIFLSPKSSFNLRDVMDNGKILLVKLDKGHLKGASDILGSLLMSKIQMAAFARTDIKESERKPFYLYVDEFQNFATESFIDTLDEARKYKLSLTLANQNLGQLPPDLRASVLTNCGIQAYFRISRYDAELLAKESYAGIFAEPQGWETYIQQLQSLPLRVCLIKNKIQGGITIIRTLNVEDNEAPAKEIGGRYLRKRKDIEKEYQARRGGLTGSYEPDGFRENKQKATGRNYEALIQDGESNRVEFKGSLRWNYETGGRDRIMEYAIVKAASAFMNSEGGTLFIGVGDDGEILGIKKDLDTLKGNKDSFLLQLINVTNQYLGKEFNQYADVKIVPINSKDVCIVEVAASAMPVFLKNAGKEEFYVRASASSQSMSVREANEYIKTHFAGRI